jgi:RNA polymerase subunit RPABC4/transcription elongation factor Spt4
MNTDTIINNITTAFSQFLDNAIVQLTLKAIAIYIIVMWLVTAFWAYRDMQRRTTNPVAPYLASALIIVFTPLLFLFAWFLYKIVRPSETVAEANERALAEEAMLVEIESQPHCANCQRTVHEEWIICPTCRNRLRRVCPNCSRLVELDWSLCAWCGKDFERPELLGAAYMPQPRSRPVPAPAPPLPEAGGMPALSPSVVTSNPEIGPAPRPLAGEH